MGINPENRQYAEWMAWIFFEGILVWIVRGIFDKSRKYDKEVKDHLSRIRFPMERK